ncbi:aldehyde dehydrogenase family protein [Sphingomonas sp.]|uniref:aldehyde dehydrogenase family protein n=1 Tax=Sphingomonas sp. TaxID=28214 RepID=UPI003D6D78B7
MFELVEEALDEVAISVEGRAERGDAFAIEHGFDAGPCPAHTAGQRCTNLRRLIVHEEVYDRLIPKLVSVYKAIAIGDPSAPETLVGPLIDGDAFAAMENALEAARAAGARVHGGRRVDVRSIPMRRWPIVRASLVATCSARWSASSMKSSRSEALSFPTMSSCAK